MNAIPSMLRMLLLVLPMLALLPEGVRSFSQQTVAKVPSPPPTKIQSGSHWLDSLKYPGEPSFDVLQKTIDYAQIKTYEEAAAFYDKDYIFRGPIIGPITSNEVKRTQQGFRIQDAYPDIETRPRLGLQ